MKVKSLYRIFYLSLILGGCLEPYEPPAIKASVNYLVVDGFIDSNTGTATVQLSRANVLTEPSVMRPEFNAQVRVEDTKNGVSYPLTAEDNGRYSTSGLLIDPLGTYTLHVRTANGRQYISDPVEI